MRFIHDPSECKYSSWAKAVSGDLKWRKTLKGLVKQRTWRKAYEIYVKKHKIMTDKRNKPYFGRIDQKLVEKYREKKKISPTMLRIRKRNWKKMFNQLKKYGEKNGNYLFPRGSREFFELKKWIRNQRNYFRKRTLVKEYLEAFNSIGFPLDVKTYIKKSKTSQITSPSEKWLSNYERLKSYARKNNGLHPPYKDKTVARWIIIQRYQFKKKMLAKIHIDLLNSIDFPWEKRVPEKTQVSK